MVVEWFEIARVSVADCTSISSVVTLGNGTQWGKKGTVPLAGSCCYVLSLVTSWRIDGKGGQ